MPLEKAGVQLVAEDQAEFESALESGNQALADFGRQADSSGGLLSGFGEIAIGALRRVGEIAVDSLLAAGAAVVGFTQDSFDSALEAEQSLTRINTLLEGQAQASAEQAAAYADAQGKFVVNTKVSEDQLDEWEDKLQKAQAQFTDLQNKLVDKEPTEVQKVQLLELQETIAGLNLKIQDGGQIIQTSLVDALGLVPPQAQLTMDGLQDLANEFAYLAGGTDDTILAIEEMALRMGNISGDEMPQFIQTALDLAAATGVDAVSGARLLAQAQEDPVSALMRFRRQGILFSEQQEEQIKKMQKAGDTAGAYAIVMERVGQATGGAALANSRTIAGQIEILKNTLGEAGEAALTGFLPVLHELTENVLPVLIPFITDLGNAIGAAFEVLGEGDIGGAFDALAQFDSIQAVLSALGISADQVYAFGGAVEDLVEQFQAAFAVFSDQAPAAFSAVMESIQPLIDSVMNLAAAFAEDFPLMLAVAEQTFNAIAETVGEFFPVIVDNVSDSLDTIAEFWRDHGELILALLSAAFQAIAFVVTSTLAVVTAVISAALTAISGIIDVATALFTGDWQGAHDQLLITAVSIWATIQETIETIFNSVLSYLGTSMEEVRADWQADWELVALTLSTIWDNIKQAVSDAIDDVKLRLSQGVLDAIENLRGLLDLFFELGEAIVNSIAWGIREKIDYMADVMLAGIRAVIRAAEDLLDMRSPSRVFMDIGRNIVLGLVSGIEEQTDKVSDAIAELFRAGTTIGGVGGAAADRFEMGVVDPLRARVEDLDSLIEGVQTEIVGATDFGEYVFLNERLTGLQRDRAEAAAELAEQEARILELQKQQDDLAFLQQQVKLLDLIQEYGLDAQSVLGDLVLGVDADLPSLIDATTNALQEIIAQTSVRLGFAPPAAPEYASGNVANTANFNLNMQTTQSTGSILSDFAVLRALAGT